MFSDIYKGRNVFVTGHNGFKGSWLCLWLQEMGAQVTGLSLPPVTTPNHWDLLGNKIDKEILADIRDFQNLKQELETAQPEIVFHLAAQPLVRASYNDPLETWSTNVMGTANLLEACRSIPSIKAIVIVTTDKCYENRETDTRYTEDDKLGGYDPYSASKAGAELVTASYRQSFFSKDAAALVASARAGNVIGGGDWSADRLIPDLARAMTKNETLEIRSPQATRPWQHVLDALYGYLLLGQKLLEGKREFADAWNFGPDESGNRTVHDVLEILKKDWPQAAWTETKAAQPHEATLLQLNSDKARTKLTWQPVWNLDSALAETAKWYRAFIEDRKVISRAQLQEYMQGVKS